ncbi:MAG: flavodoxin family protein [Planctomycetes bacterium]|nr:flavodoxin family protein [Planctomycetota bacterium]
MSRILVVYHSGGGNTEQMARLVAEGARDAGADVELKSVEDTLADELLDYDGIIAGSPTYYGLMSAPLKALFDDSVRFHQKLTGKVGGAFTSCANIGGGNETTILSILQAMLIHGMIVQGSASGDHFGPVSIGAPDQRAAEQSRQLGARVARLAGRLCGGKGEL